MSQFIPIIAVFIVLTCVDQATKYLAQRGLEPGRFYRISGRFGFRLVTRSQSGYGALYGRYVAPFVVILIALVCVVLGCEKAPSLWHMYGLGLVLGGACGNPIDRLSRKRVVDFITWRGWRTFNLADVAMVAGVLLTWTIL